MCIGVMSEGDEGGDGDGTDWWLYPSYPTSKTNHTGEQLHRLDRVMSPTVSAEYAVQGGWRPATYGSAKMGSRQFQSQRVCGSRCYNVVRL